MSENVYFVRITESASDFYNLGCFTLEEMAQVAGTTPSWCVQFTDYDQNLQFTFEVLPPIKGDRDSILTGFDLCKDEYGNEDRFKEKEVLPLDNFNPQVEYGNGNDLIFNSEDNLIDYWESISK